MTTTKDGLDLCALPTTDWLELHKRNDPFWIAALEGDIGDSTSLQQVIRCCRFFDITTDPGDAPRLANVAWVNGAALATLDADHILLKQQEHMSALGQHLFEVMNSVYPQIHDDVSLIRHRLVLNEAITRIGFDSFGNIENLFAAAMYAGKLGITEGDLHTGLLIVPESRNASELFIMNLGSIASGDLTMGETRESVAWIFGKDYLRGTLEHAALTDASAASMAKTRTDSGELIQFIADGFNQGSRYPHEEKRTLFALLDEVEELEVRRVHDMFQRYADHNLENATLLMAWEAMIPWFNYVHGDMSDVSTGLRGLHVARLCYDFLFWFGLIRESIREGFIEFN